MAFVSTAPSGRKERARLIHARLAAQSLAVPAFDSAAAAVAAFGAMQGQDLPGLISSIALRLTGSAEDRVARVLADFNSGALVRGYPMRGTVFGLAGVDARWITELAAKPKEWEAPRRRAGLGIEPEHVSLAREVTERVLAEHPRGLSRADLFAKWVSAGVSPDGGVGYHLSTYFIACGLLIYGPHNGKDNNLVLAREWLPENSSLEARFNGDRTAAAAALLDAYLFSHGPASIRDFAWWTKLPLREIRAALPLMGERIAQWGSDGSGEALYARGDLEELMTAAGSRLDATYLLPGFDELVLGYPDRLALLTEEQHKILAPGNNGVFMKAIVRRGQIVGTWRRKATTLVHEPFAELPKVALAELEKTFGAYPHPA